MSGRIFFFILFFFICSLNSAFAQGSASLPDATVRGRVLDQNSAAIQGAKVQLKKTSGQSVSETVSSAEGFFTLTASPGEYQIQVSAAYFAPQQRNISLPHSAGSSQPDLEFRLATYIELTGVTIRPTSDRLASEEVALITALDAQAVRSSAAQTTDDLLRQIPGFSNFRRSSSLVANPTTQGVSLRGAGASGASRTLVLLDGMPVNDAFGGWIYWDRVPRLIIENIEMLRGGASDLYGSDALSGVISLNTRNTQTTVLNAEAGFGNRATMDFAFFASHSFLKKNDRALTASVSGEGLWTDGWYLLAPNIRGAADTQAFSKHRLLNLRLTSGASGNDSSQYFLRGSLFDEDRNNGTRLQLNDTTTESIAAGGHNDNVRGNNFAYLIFANRQRFHQTFSAVAATRATETLTRQQFVPATDVGANLTWSQAFRQHLLMAGADVRGVRGTSDELIFAAGRAITFASAGGRQLRSGFFAQDAWAITSRLQLSGSVRLDLWRNSSAASVERTLATGAVRPRFFPERTEKAFNPRLTLNYQWHSRLSLRASGYRAFRAPTLNELYRAFRVGDTLTTANENLTAERLSGGEIGASWKVSGNVSLRTTGYFTEIVNPVTNFTLSVTPTLITRQRQNLGRLRSAGIESEFDLRIKNDWQISAGYLFADATVRQAPQDVRLVGLQLPQVPRHQFTLQAGYSRPDIVTATIQFRAAGQQFDDDRNLFALPSYTVMDVFASRRLGKFIEVFVAAQNIWNETVIVGRTPLETLGTPRLLRGGLRLKFER
jgi:outer membrane receptor protein involved in Fe transport